MAQTKEHERLNSDGDNWKRWGPYLSERAWGTVREDYSEDGNAWMYFPHDQARSLRYGPQRFQLSPSRSKRLCSSVSATILSFHI